VSLFREKPNAEADVRVKLCKTFLIVQIGFYLV